MTGYKAIIKNMVEMEVTTYVEKKSGKFIEINSIDLITSKDFDYPTFEVELIVGLGEIIKRDFLIRGYVSEYGSVVISSCSFERTVVRFPLNSELPETRMVSKFLTADELDNFKFDR